jgi:hypothetical protein
MGAIARLLGWVWRRWADYNSVVALLDLLDWKTGIVAIVAGVAMTFFGANSAWSAPGVVLAALAASACLATISVAFRLAISGPLPLAPNQTATIDLQPDLDARVAFYEILANSKWAEQQRPGTDQPSSDWLPRRLDREIHNLLRQNRIKAWGSRCLTTSTEAPESEISAAEWDNIEIDFAPLNQQLPRTSAMRRIRQGGFNTVFAGVRFCRHQIYGVFRLILPDMTPTPGGIQPDWPIRELFLHIQPDLLDNPNDTSWERVGNDLRDAFALNLVKVWGRPITGGIGKLLGERQTLRLIDPSYWHSAYFHLPLL